MSWLDRPPLIVQLAAADATVLAASTTLERRLKHIRVVNTSSSAQATFNLALGAAFAANIAIFNSQLVLPNDVFREFWSPGHEWTNLAVRAFASVATTLTMHLYYQERPV